MSRRVPQQRSENPFAPLLARESGTLYRHATRNVVLCYPNTYGVAGSSLGWQLLYRLLNTRDGLACQRAVLPDDPGSWRAHGRKLTSLEFADTLGAFDAILVSIAYELDVARLVEMLDLAGVEPLAARRSERAPPVIGGGPLTQSNVLPLGPFCDVVVMGEAEHAMPKLLDWLHDGVGRTELARLAASERGFWVPAVHGDAVPELLAAEVDDLPSVGQTRSPDTELADMMLIETSRGCPRYCKFCVVRAPVAPMRSVPLQTIVDVLDSPALDEAPRVGFVGAAVSDWPHLKGALRASLARGKRFGVSSLRADRLDDELVDLLIAGGYRSLTVASDAPSERLRGRMMKALRERHLLAAADQAKRAGMGQLKMYVILGLPDEREEDCAELVALGRKLAERTRTVITISPFVPKLHTPMAGDPFEAIPSQERKLDGVRRALGGVADVRFDPPKWAWIEYRLSQGGMDAGLAAMEASRAGGTFSAWREAFGALDARSPEHERAALGAAERHALWPVSGAR